MARRPFRDDELPAAACAKIAAMSRRRMVALHVGLPKTGTTYLQERFVQHRAQLGERGVHYPRFGQEHGSGHHNLGFALRGMPALDADWGELSAEQAVRRALDERPDQHVLLSSEGLSALDADAVATLRRALGDCDVRVAVYLRRRSRLMRSSWQEAVKHGSPLGLREYVATRVLESGARMLRFEQVLLGIAQAFGRDALRVVVYDHLVEGGEDLFAHFVGSILELDGFVAEPPAPRANASIGAAELDVVRGVNQARLQRGERPSIDDSGPLLRLLARDAAARELVERVELLRDARGEDVDLRVLDGEWLDRDRHVLELLGDAVLNPAGPHELFRLDGAPTIVRALRPAELHAAIPIEAFAALADRAAADRAP